MRLAHPHLTRREAQAVLDHRLAEITPLLPPPLRPPGVRPLSVMIGGTPGTGKTTIQWLIQQSLGASVVAVYDLDDDLAAHPRYDAIMRSHGLRAAEIVSKGLPSDLRHQCLDHLRGLQYDVITSAPFHEEGSTKTWAHPFRRAGYRNVLVYVVTNEANSALGRADRYVRALDDVGYGRWVDPDLCVRADAWIPDTADAIEAASFVDDLYVVDRFGYVLYENHRGDDARMGRPFLAKATILAERNRPPTPEEHQQFLTVVHPLLERTDTLAEPVTDLIQVAINKHIERPAPQPLTRELRLDDSLLDLRRITADGVASPQVITSATTNTRGPAGRSPTGNPGLRTETDR
jgi:predicted ABC-type ATPase